MSIRIPLVMVLAGLSCGAAAFPEGPSSKAQETSETWLQLQPRGLHASEKSQAATPVEKDKSMERWLKAYENKIPEAAERGVSSSKGGSR